MEISFFKIHIYVMKNPQNDFGYIQYSFRGDKVIPSW